MTLIVTGEQRAGMRYLGGTVYLYRSTPVGAGVEQPSFKLRSELTSARYDLDAH